MKPKLNLRYKLRKGLGPHVIDVTVKKDCLLVYALKFFGILAGRCGSGKEERLGQERSGIDPWLRFSFFLMETISITGQNVFRCLQNGRDRLQKGNLH